VGRMSPGRARRKLHGEGCCLGNEVLVRDDPVDYAVLMSMVIAFSPLDQMLETLVDDVRRETRDEHDIDSQGGVTAYGSCCEPVRRPSLPQCTRCWLTCNTFRRPANTNAADHRKSRARAFVVWAEVTGIAAAA
jgi:hypothetical protein